MHRDPHWIDGKPSAPANGQWLDVFDPATRELASYVARLERNLAEPMKLGAATIRTQASIGVTLVAPEDERTAIEILRDADAAMYATKAKRRRGYGRPADGSPR